MSKEMQYYFRGQRELIESLRRGGIDELFCDLLLANVIETERQVLAKFTEVEAAITEAVQRALRQ